MTVLTVRDGAIIDGSGRRVEFTIHTDLVSFTGRSGQRIVEPGRIELRLGPSSADIAGAVPVELTGPQRTISGPRTMTTEVKIEDGVELPTIRSAEKSFEFSEECSACLY